MFKAHRIIMLASRSIIKEVSYKIKHTWPKLNSCLIIIMAFTCLVCPLSHSMQLSKTSQDPKSEAIDMEVFWDYTLDDSGQTKYTDMVGMFLDELPAYQALWPKLPKEVGALILKKVLRDNDLFDWIIGQHELPARERRHKSTIDSSNSFPLVVSNSAFSSTGSQVAVNFANAPSFVYDLIGDTFQSIGNNTFVYRKGAISFDDTFFPTIYLLDERRKFYKSDLQFSKEDLKDCRVLTRENSKLPIIHNHHVWDDGTRRYLKFGLGGQFKTEPLNGVELDRPKEKLLAYGSHKLCVWLLDDPELHGDGAIPLFCHISQETISFAQFNYQGETVIVAYNGKSQVDIFDITSGKRTKHLQISPHYGMLNFWFCHSSGLAIGLLYDKDSPNLVHNRQYEFNNPWARTKNKLVIWDINNNMSTLHVRDLKNNHLILYEVASPYGLSLLIGFENKYIKLFSLRDLYKIITFFRNEITLEHAMLLCQIKKAALKNEKFDFRNYKDHYQTYFSQMPKSLQKALSNSVIVPN